MDVLVLSLGAFTLLLSLVHVRGGGRACLEPMLRATFDPVARATMHVVWHGVTAQLTLSGAVMVAVGLGMWSESGPLLVAAIAVLHLVYAALFLTIAAVSGLPRAWLSLGQWMAFLPMGVVGLMAAI